MSMVKLIHSSAFDTTMEVGMTIVYDAQGLTKSAGTIFGREYEELKPDKGHVGIHLTALGDYERYGLNRNFDGFSKQSCVRDHGTFVENGAVFRHHRNKDRAKSLGTIKTSAYNEPMGRIELFVHVDESKAADELSRLEKEGEIPFSMAVRVPFDVCTKCGTHRKGADDPNQCGHIKHELGKMAEDGTVVGMLNTDNNWFDISFVGRPADRIAWNLKVASGEIVDSVKLAEASGLWVPDYIAIESDTEQRKYAHLKAIVAMQDRYCGWLSKQAAIRTNSDQYIYELRKVAGSVLGDSTIKQLRELDPKVAFAVLARAGVILDPRSFFKYAMGLDYGELAQYIDKVACAVPSVMAHLVKEGECQKVCTDSTFDVVVDRTNLRGVPLSLTGELSKQAIAGPSLDERMISAAAEGLTSKFAVDTDTRVCSNNDATVALAEKYAAYKVAAVEAVIAYHHDTDTSSGSVQAVAAAQNLVIR